MIRSSRSGADQHWITRKLAAELGVTHMTMARVWAAALARPRGAPRRFEYYRHDTLSLFAAFNAKTGEVFGHTAARHTSADFVAFLTELVAMQPRR